MPVAKHTITVELDEDTVEALRELGEPADILVRLAREAAGPIQHSGQVRQRTDKSLSVERLRADDRIKDRPGAVDADEQAADRKGLAEDRRTTDHHLHGERAQADSVQVSQRDANQQLVVATLRSEELAEEADAARTRAVAGERALEEVGRFRELFIGALGHDLRNPLNAISIAAASLIRRGRLDPKDAETTARILRGGQRIERMITQLLDLTRARLGGGFPIDRKPADLAAIVEAVTEGVEAKIEVHLEGNLEGFWDPDRLEELLSNLLGNAVQYAAPDSPVRVNAREDGSHVVVEVANDGAPIPPELLPHLFEPFHRAKGRATAVSGNLGLGLFIAREIVTSHSGTIEARSEGGRTTFEVRLPRGSPGAAPGA